MNSCPFAHLLIFAADHSSRHDGPVKASEYFDDHAKPAEQVDSLERPQSSPSTSFIRASDLPRKHAARYAPYSTDSRRVASREASSSLSTPDRKSYTVKSSGKPYAPDDDETAVPRDYRGRVRHNQPSVIWLSDDDQGDSTLVVQERDRKPDIAKIEADSARSRRSNTDVHPYRPVGQRFQLSRDREEKPTGLWGLPPPVESSSPPRPPENMEEDEKKPAFPLAHAQFDGLPPPVDSASTAPTVALENPGVMFDSPAPVDDDKDSVELAVEGSHLSPEASLSQEQKDVLGQVLSGRSLCFTGSAGVGKSVLLRAIIKALEKKHLERYRIAVTAVSFMGDGFSH